MFDRVILKSGQFILAKSKLEIDIDNFRLLVEDALAVYSKYTPATKRYQIYINYPRQFVFDEYYDPDFKSPPDWISSVKPIRTPGTSIYGMTGGVSCDISNPYNNQELIDPIQAPWDYYKPVLTVPYSAKYEILACYNHKIISYMDEENMDKLIYEVKSITTEDQGFLRLLQGLFLQGIGRSRRSFTMGDIPITADADVIASEGKELETEATEGMRANTKFYLAYR